MLKTDLAVLENERIARNIYRTVLHGEVARKTEAPGQFIHIRCGDGWEMPLRRPISIASRDKEKETITIIYRGEGRGTAWLAKRTPGELVDVLGPLGNGFSVSQGTGQKVLLVGGGIGVPPLYGLAQELKQQGMEIEICLGFASREDAFLVEAFSEIGPTKVATDDGTLGHGGLVTDLLLHQPLAWDTFYACGPLPMLAALQRFFAGTDTDGYLSLEQRMGCGIGACLACVCPTKEKGGLVKICSDGPVFRCEEVAL